MTSTPGPPDPAPAVDPLTAALEGMDRLTAAIDGMSKQLKAVSGRLTVAEETTRGNRRIIVGLIVSFCLDLIVTAGFGYNTVQVNGAQGANHASEINACQQANVNRAQDIAIWNRFLADLAPAAAKSAKAKAELAGINALVKIKDAPRDCQQLYAK